MPAPFRITTIHAFTTIGEDGDEGIPAILLDGTWMPMVCADKARLDSMRPQAQAIATRTGKSIKLVRFSVRSDIETIVPKRQP